MAFLFFVFCVRYKKESDTLNSEWAIYAFTKWSLNKRCYDSTFLPMSTNERKHRILMGCSGYDIYSNSLFWQWILRQLLCRTCQSDFGDNETQSKLITTDITLKSLFCPPQNALVKGEFIKIRTDQDDTICTPE